MQVSPTITHNCSRETCGKCRVVNEHNHMHVTDFHQFIYTENMALQLILIDPDFDIPSQPASFYHGVVLTMMKQLLS